jgi:hypothetical protein
MLISVLRGTAVLAAAVVVLFAPGMARAENVDNRLLETYQPVTHLDPVEQFRPASVQSFVADADLERFDGGSWAVVDPDPEPGELPGPGTGTWRLNQDSCMPTLPTGGLSCYAAAGAEGDGASVVYGRVARPPGGEIVLQYWYFYYDNTYVYPFLPPSDTIWQAHEGDWEVVNVVLSENEQPLFVGYSQHCLGQQRAWDDTLTLDTHPIVHVAAGSHANYFSAGSHDIDTRCLPAQAIAYLQQQKLPLPVDRSFDGGEVAGPREAGGTFTHIRAIEDGHPSWVAFPGFWGELQYVHAPAPIGTVPFGTSPQGPTYHLVWADPLGTMAGWETG